MSVQSLNYTPINPAILKKHDHKTLMLVILGMLLIITTIIGVVIVFQVEKTYSHQALVVPSPTPVAQTATPTITPAPSKTPTVNDQKTARLITALDYFQQVVKENPNQNLVVSPASINYAISMLLNGANRQTKTVLLSYLNLGNFSLDSINSFSGKLISELSSNQDPTLVIANSLWPNISYKINDNFLNQVTNNYRATVTPVNYVLPETVNKINSWVSEKTNKLIPQIVDKLEENIVVSIINTIYLKADWENQFEPYSTHNQIFNLANNQSTTAPFMHNTLTVKYLENELFQAVSLPYQSKKGLAMEIFLPKKDLNQVLANFNESNWSNWQNNFKPTYVYISLPKFKYDFRVEYNPKKPLKGLENIFDKDLADFSLMADRKIYISEIIHKAVIITDEKGTEAAAVTAIFPVSGGIERETKPVEFKADKPFIFFIYNPDNKEVLFAGIVLNPAL